MECQICLEKYNNSTTKKITCAGCSKLTCRRCVETYLLSSFDEPNCMHCKKIWTLDFLREIFTKTFCETKLKKHREDLLYEKEKSLMPVTQAYIEILNKRSEVYKEISVLYKKRDEIDRLIDNKREAIRAIENEAENKDIAKKANYIRKCPMGECRGFLSSAYKCGLCNVWVCPDCKEIKGTNRSEEHTCDPNILASVKAIANDSKACPNCSSLIFKIEGCSQIFCTSCTTVFDWNTGKINVGGPVHNPHYFEWVRKNGGGAVRPIGDVPCGGLPNLFQFDRTTMRYKNQDELLNRYRIVAEISDEWMRRYPVASNLHGNRDLRIQYLRKEIDEVEFKRQLQIREKKEARNRVIRQILDTFVVVGVEIINSICDLKDIYDVKHLHLATTEIAKYLIRLDEIRIYTNECLKDSAKKFNCKALHILDDWSKVTKV